MATVKPADPLPRRRRARRAALLVAVVLVAALAWFWRPLNDRASAATGYAARVACSCRFVAGRPLGSCRGDMLKGMGPLMLSEDAEAKSVTARLLPLSSATATLRDGAGCVLEPWDD